MYTIYEIEKDKKYHCCCQIQDGTERWYENSLEKAKQSLIAAAKIYNGTYIHGNEIALVYQETPPSYFVSKEEMDLLREIKSGHKKVIPFDDPYFKYRVTTEECEIIYKIRIGELGIVKPIYIMA